MMISLGLVLALNNQNVQAVDNGRLAKAIVAFCGLTAVTLRFVDNGGFAKTFSAADKLITGEKGLVDDCKEVLKNFKQATFIDRLKSQWLFNAAVAGVFGLSICSILKSYKS